MKVRSYLDPTADRFVRGWVWDVGRPFARLTVSIFVDDELHASVVAGLFRPDLASAGIGDGHHAFEVELPGSVFDGFPHSVTASVTGGDGVAHELDNSPMPFQALVDGAVDSVEPGAVSGWLHDRQHLQASLSFSLYGDGIRIGAGVTNARQRFRVRVPSGFSARHWTFAASRARADKVDVIVPIYAGLSESLATLEHAAAASQTTPFEVIAILDNPQDEVLADALLQQQSRLGYTLLRNEKNLGFVATVNRGMALHRDRDVVLLNADTVVHGDWIDRLRRAVYDEAHNNGSATPFSNDATICSYPRFCAGSPVADHDELCRRMFPGQTVEIPTAVGFCVYIRRDCLTETGLFDAVTFGRGYGEENDFCMRARRYGWRHVLAADVYVAHVGHVSFGGSGVSQENTGKLTALHPDYLPLVEDFIRRDPLQPLRRALDFTFLTPWVNRMCIVTNTLGGGNERYVQEKLAATPGAVLMRCRDCRYVSLDARPNLEFDLPAERDLLVDALRRLGVSRLQINQIVDAPLDIFDLGIPYEVTVHDYAWICPQVTLQDETGEYCGEPDVRHCEACYRKLGPHKSWGNLLRRGSSVAEIRDQHRSVLRRADSVVFPSEDARQRLSRYFEFKASRVEPHDSIVPAMRRRRKQADEARAKVAYIGSLGYPKGYIRLLDLALDRLKRNLPIEYFVIGSPVDSRPLVELGVTVTGHYDGDGEAHEWISRIAPHLALFPGVLPESYSYTLSLAFEQGLYPVAFDLGAIAERIRASGFGTLIPLGATSAEINDLLVREA